MVDKVAKAFSVQKFIWAFLRRISVSSTVGMDWNKDNHCFNSRMESLIASCTTFPSPACSGARRMSRSVSICNGTSNKIDSYYFSLKTFKLGQNETYVKTFVQNLENNKYIFTSSFRNPFSHIENEIAS